MKITKKQLDAIVENLVMEQFEWTDEELASMGEEDDDTEADEWFSDFTGEMTGLEDDEDDYPWDDEFVGKADRAERHVQEAKKNRCWDGYKPVKGKKPYSKGSCEKVDETKKKKKEKSPADKVRKPTAPPSRQHKDPTRYDRKRDKKVPLDEMSPRAKRWASPRPRGGSMVSGENVASTLVNKVMADLRRILGQKVSWVDIDSWEKLEQALTQVARQAYSELDELD